MKKLFLQYLAIVVAVVVILFVIKAAWHIIVLAIGIGAVIFTLHAIEKSHDDLDETP